jgi:hypothetical protein
MLHGILTHHLHLLLGDVFHATHFQHLQDVVERLVLVESSQFVKVEQFLHPRTVVVALLLNSCGVRTFKDLLSSSTVR